MRLVRNEHLKSTGMPSQVNPTDKGDVIEFGPFRLLLRHRKLFCRDDEVSIGGRAMEVLRELARTTGEVVTKERLFAAAWPDAFVHESNLKVTIAAIRRALRDHAFGKDYIKTVVGRGYWLDATPGAEEPTASAEVTLPVGTPLPELSSVIGRDSVIAELRDTIASNRLTTIAGAGGIGKTTVAVAAAHLFEDDHGGVATFVDLGRVTSGDFVSATIAAAMGLSSTHPDILQAIVALLERRRSLLLLDTCEQACNEVAHLCEVIMAKTSHVRILATSRHILRTQHEKVFWLAPLALPPTEHSDTAADVLRYAAPQLLATRALEQGGYRLRDEDASTFAEICNRLDGAPLALELVAPRLALRGAEAVLRELDDRLGVLQRETPGGPLRQQTLLVTLEWSYALLTDIEASVLRALSIFAGSFDTDSAVRLVAHLALAPVDAFDAIAGLRAKSMLSLDPSSEVLRYRLLDTTKAFACTLLATATHELSFVIESHARLQLDIQTRAALEHATMTAHKWHATYGGQADDLRKAIDWALHPGGAPLLGIRLVAAGITLWQELSLAEEARSNCQRALVAFADTGCTDMSLKLKLVAGLASVNAYAPRDAAATEAIFREALALAREIDDPVAECRALAALALFKVLPADPGAAEVLDAMHGAALRSNDRSALWEEQQLRAQSDVGMGNLRAGHDRLQSLSLELEQLPTSAMPRFHVHQKVGVDVQMGALSWLIGRPGRALSCIDQGVRGAIESRHALTLIYCLSRGIIFVYMLCGDYDSASLYTQMLRRSITRHGLTDWLPVADCYTEALGALAGGRSSEESLGAAVASLSQGQLRLNRDAYSSALVAAMVAIGAMEDAARTLEASFSEGPRPWVLPELLRLRAATERVLVDDRAAESTLIEALGAARKVGALGWELRAAIDIAVLLNDHGQEERARETLSATFAQFTDGFETADLRRARDLLARLPGSPREHGTTG